MPFPRSARVRCCEVVCSERVYLLNFAHNKRRAYDRRDAPRHLLSFRNSICFGELPASKREPIAITTRLAYILPLSNFFRPGATHYKDATSSRKRIPVMTRKSATTRMLVKLIVQGTNCNRMQWPKLYNFCPKRKP